MRSYTSNGGFIGRTASIIAEDYYVNIGSAPVAIQYVGGTTQAFLGSTTNDVVSLTGLTGGIASAPRYGDFILVAAERSGTNNKVFNIADFEVIADLYQNDAEDSNLHVGYAFATPIPQTSVTITGGSGNTADGLAVAVHVYRNVSLTNPLDVTSTTAGGIDGAIPNPPAITPVTSGALIVVAAGAAHDATAGGAFTASYLSNFITTNTVSLGETNDATVGMGNVAWTSGAYDPAAWTFTGTGGTATNWAQNSVTMALRPGPTVTLGNKRNSGVWDFPGQIMPKLIDVTGQQEYISAAGTFSFTVPENVFEISAVTVGGGGGGAGQDKTDEPGAGGGGGGLAYGTFPVTPGETLTAIVGAGGSGGGGGNNGSAGGASRVQRNGVDLIAAGGGGGGQPEGGSGGAGGTVIVGSGGVGGQGGNTTAQAAAPGGGGGGAGGYSGAGGAGGSNVSLTGVAAATGSGAGGGGNAIVGANTTQGGGGGVGLYSIGPDGAASGGGGSGGANGTATGGLYGGGGVGSDRGDSTSAFAGARGAVRLIWGKAYSFPNDAPPGIVTSVSQGGINYLPQIDQY